MVSTSTIIIIVICTLLVAVGGLGAFYFKTQEDAAQAAVIARENAAKAEADRKAAEERASAAEARVATAKTEYQKAEEQLEIAKLEAAALKFSTDAGKSAVEAKLISASRAFEEASARLKEAEQSNLTEQEELNTARKLAEAARIELEAAEESARIVAEAEATGAAIIAQGGADATSLEGDAASLIEEANNTATTIRDLAAGICKGTCPGTLSSQHLAYKLVTQSDGNLVLYGYNNKVHWSSGTSGRGIAPYKLVMQTDGNLVLYDTTTTPIWSSGTAGKGKAPYRVVMQNDRNLVIYDAANTALWSTGTAHRNFTIRGYDTNASNDEGGHVRFLDRQHVNCGDDALNRFQLTRPSGNTISYRVHCLEGVNNSSTGWNYTAVNSDGGGNMTVLKNHKVDCGNKAISEFVLRNPAKTAQIKYAFRCSNLPHTGQCREMVTSYDADGSGNSVYLDRQNVSCGEGEAMSSFVLEQNSSKNRVRYNYKCCAMPT